MNQNQFPPIPKNNYSSVNDIDHLTQNGNDSKRRINRYFEDDNYNEIENQQNIE